MIHLNNAGTSFPKPPSVAAAVHATLQATPERWPSIFAEAEATVCQFLGIADSTRFLFTSGCTSALAIVMNDLPWAEGDRILTSSLEHHALARWLLPLARDRGVVHTASPYAPGAPLDLDWLTRELARGRVRLVACTMASNVTGELLPVVELARLAHAHGALCLIDAAQTVGAMPVAVSALGADILVFAGHKGPLGPHGIGGLYVAPTVQLSSPESVCELPAPGTRPGIEPAGCAPMASYCDVGSANLAAAAGLAAGVRWLEERGLDHVRAHIQALTARLLDGLRALAGVRVVGAPGAEARTGAVSMTFADREPGVVEERLRAAGIVTRAGHHCASMAHAALGTERAGTLRVSVGALSTPADVDAALAALATLVGN